MYIYIMPTNSNTRNPAHLSIYPIKQSCSRRVMYIIHPIQIKSNDFYDNSISYYKYVYEMLSFQSTCCQCVGSIVA